MTYGLDLSKLSVPFDTILMNYITFFFLVSIPLYQLETVNSDYAEINDTEVYESNDRCNFTLVAPKKVINPYKADLKNVVPQKPFGSIYLKCAACMAVANQVSKIIKSIISKTEESHICQNCLNENISSKINELCTQGFKNYDLRRCKEFSIVTDTFKCTEHVVSNMDGGWTKKLRELCNLYTSHMDLEHITNIYLNKIDQLGVHLCKSTGIFRDCQNLEVDPPNNSEENCYC